MGSKLVWGLAIALLSEMALAQVNMESQAYLECGNVACDVHSNAPFAGATGINDLNVDGDLFDVSFMGTAPATSPFVLSSSTAAPGQPITGVDAAEAISLYYGALEPPFLGGYPYAGDQGPIFITSFGPAGSLSSVFTQFGEQPVTELYDAVQTYVGGDYNAGGNFYNVAEAGTQGNSFSDLRTASGAGPFNAESNPVLYTTWTPIAAPEIDLSSGSTGIALLLGGIAVQRGRQQRRLVH